MLRTRTQQHKIISFRKEVWYDFDTEIHGNHFQCFERFLLDPTKTAVKFRSFRRHSRKYPVCLWCVCFIQTSKALNSFVNMKWYYRWPGSYTVGFTNNDLSTNMAAIWTCCRLQLKCDGTRWRTGGEVKGETGELSGNPLLFTLSRNMVYPALLPLMRTTRLPVVAWTEPLPI